MSGRDREVELELHLHNENDRSIMVSEDGDADKAVFLPLSQIKFHLSGRNTIVVECPEWLAKDRGLI